MKSTKPNKEYEHLLKLCYKIRSTTGFFQASMLCEPLEELEAYLKKRKRYRWEAVGAAYYLYPYLLSTKENPVAVILQQGPRVFNWQLVGTHITGKHDNGTCTKLSDAKARVNELFKVIE